MGMKLIHMIGFLMEIHEKLMFHMGFLGFS